LQFRYYLAEHLHKTVGEINRMDIREFMGWVAWLEMRQKNGK